MQDLTLFTSERELQAAQGEILLPDAVRDNVLKQFREIYEDFENLCLRSVGVNALPLLEAAAMASRLRKEAASLRLRSEKLRKALKADSIAYGKFVQNLHNVLARYAKGTETLFNEIEQRPYQKTVEDNIQLREEREDALLLPATHDADMGMLSEEQFAQELALQEAAVASGAAEAYLNDIAAYIDFIPAPSGCEGLKRNMLQHISNLLQK